MNEPETQSLPETLTIENFRSGFLIDDEVLGGVAEDPERPGTFVAFIVRHATGEPVAAHSFGNAEEAIRSLKSQPRNWEFQQVHECGGGTCGAEGCGTGGCCGPEEGHDHGHSHDHGHDHGHSHSHAAPAEAEADAHGQPGGCCGGH